MERWWFLEPLFYTSALVFIIGTVVLAVIRKLFNDDPVIVMIGIIISQIPLVIWILLAFIWLVSSFIYDIWSAFL